MRQTYNYCLLEFMFYRFIILRVSVSHKGILGPLTLSKCVQILHGDGINHIGMRMFIYIYNNIGTTMTM